MHLSVRLIPSRARIRKQWALGQISQCTHDIVYEVRSALKQGARHQLIVPV